MRAFIVSVVFLISACAKAAIQPPPPPTPPEPFARSDRIEKAGETFKMFLSYAEQNYYGSFDTEIATRWAIANIITRLNPHGHLSAPETPQTSCHAEKGLGMEMLVNRDGRVMVTRVAYASGAFEADISPGDVIIGVDGVPIVSQSCDEVSFLIVCNDKPAIHLRILRDTYVLNKTIPKGKNKFREFATASFHNHVEYLWISNVGSGGEWKQPLENALERLRKNPNHDFILDLRSMLGGWVHAATGIVSMFVPPNTPLIATGSGMPITSTYNGNALHNRVMVLTNRATISSGEIIALGFKNTDRALIIGERTGGFGTFLSKTPLPDGSSFDFPTVEYFGALGEVVDGRGVAPNIEVQDTNPIGHYVPGLSDAILERALKELGHGGEALQYAKAR